MAKYVTFGKVLRKKDEKTGKTKDFIVLGQANPKNSKYDFDVTVTVIDKSGKVLASQKNGFVTLQNPRTLHDELKTLNAISDEQYEKMKERATKIPEMISRELVLTVK